MRSIEEIQERITKHEQLIERSREWKATSEAFKQAYEVFRAILEAEIGQLQWVLS